MNLQLLRKHINLFVSDSKKNPNKFKQYWDERIELISYYQKYDATKILEMTEEHIFEYISKLWAMLIWGNKHYKVDKILLENGLTVFKDELAQLLWGNESIVDKWDHLRTTIKGMGPAMNSEILCHTHPTEYLLWNKRAYVGLD